MNIFNLVYKIKKAKTEKSSAVDRLKMANIYLNKKGFLKPLPSCKYANPSHSYYLNKSFISPDIFCCSIQLKVPCIIHKKCDVWLP